MCKDPRTCVVMFPSPYLSSSLLSSLPFRRPLFHSLPSPIYPSSSLPAFPPALSSCSPYPIHSISLHPPLTPYPPLFLRPLSPTVSSFPLPRSSPPSFSSDLSHNSLWGTTPLFLSLLTQLRRL
ncbi:unnamed protein product [Closterium sp. NIES-64]|nr:unnamed protein product [Closterium sp. NIES-64]